MQHAASAYAKVSREAIEPRELEASLLIKAAAQLQFIRDDFDNRRSGLDGALIYNRKLWTVLVASVTAPENPQPRSIKKNIANLALFVFNRTLSITSASGPESLDILIKINRDLAAGLRGSATSGLPNPTP